jgi:hypothetical protein
MGWRNHFYKITIVTAIAGALAVCEQRMLSGYWFAPDSIASRVHAEHVIGFSSFVASESTARLELSTPPDPAGVCGGTLSAYTCDDGRHVAEIFSAAHEPLRPLRTVNPRLWQVVRTQLVRDVTRDPRLDSPATGVAIEFTRNGSTFIWVQYSTGEIQHDWHRRGEALYSVNADRCRLMDQTSYRYEVAGLEGISAWHLWLLNGILLTVGGAISLRATRNQLGRVQRVATWIGGITLMVVGGTLGGSILGTIHSHDPWLVVFLITAALLVVPGAITCTRLASGRRNRT